MTIPVTFSAPPDETFPELNGYVPSLEDSIRKGVWLMLRADDVNRKAHSNDPEDAAAGVNIYQGRPAYDPDRLSIKRLPCQVVDIAPAGSDFRYLTANAGERIIIVGVSLLNAASTALLPEDASVTTEAMLSRVRSILMRGTLWKSDMSTNKGRVIDPFFAPRNEDGTYAAPPPSAYLNMEGPDIRPSSPRYIQNRYVRTAKEAEDLHPVRDFAVSFGWRAAYRIIVGDRDTPR